MSRSLRGRKHHLNFKFFIAKRKKEMTTFILSSSQDIHTFLLLRLVSHFCVCSSSKNNKNESKYLRAYFIIEKALSLDINIIFQFS